MGQHMPLCNRLQGKQIGSGLVSDKEDLACTAFAEDTEHFKVAYAYFAGRFDPFIRRSGGVRFTAFLTSFAGVAGSGSGGNGGNKLIKVH